MKEEEEEKDMEGAIAVFPLGSLSHEAVTISSVFPCIFPPRFPPLLSQPPTPLNLTDTQTHTHSFS